ncbi:low molecular weight phosphatase family protein [Actinoplanes sp. NPDC051411]|uniref:arsenate reductase/protein-tyrosine-phosphatase family protein n=1 Tax=Actinoplanes sp. NPDC051411 TaxID=3155522 RepID=UPI003431D4AB
MTFAILHVCVGNICRSVLAERLTTLEALRRFGPDTRPVQVTSAGTRARPGAPMHPYAAAALRARGAPTDHFAARRLTPVAIAAADLVLTATAAERDDVLTMLPAALDRTFTLREFARLATHLPPAAGEPAAVVAAALGLRWRVAATDPDGDDIVDPRRTRRGLQACAAVTATAVRSTMEALFATEGAVRAR